MRACVFVVLVLAVSAPSGGQTPAAPRAGRGAVEHYHAGQMLLAREQWTEAAAAFDQAIEREPLFTDAHYGRGQAFMALRQYQEAIEAFGDCIDAARRLHALRQTHREQADAALGHQIQALEDSIRQISRAAGRRRSAAAVADLERRLAALERQRSAPTQIFVVPAPLLLSLGSAHFHNGNRELADMIGRGPSRWSPLSAPRATTLR